MSGALIPLSHSTVAVRAGSQTRTGIPALEAPCLCLSTMPALEVAPQCRVDDLAAPRGIVERSPTPRRGFEPRPCGFGDRCACRYTTGIGKWPAGLEPAPPGPQPGALPLSYGHGLRNVMASAGFEPTCRGRMRAAEPQAPPAAREWGGRESNPHSQTPRGYNPLGSPVPVPPREPPGRIRTCA